MEQFNGSEVTIGGAIGPLNGLKWPKWAILWQKSGLVAPNWWNCAEQDCSKSGLIWADALEPFHGTEVAIGGRHRPSKWEKGPKWAFLWP